MAKQKKSDRLRMFVPVRHEFSQDEYRDASRELTRAMEIVKEEKARAKTQASESKARINQLEAQVDELANKLRNGGDERPTEVSVEFMAKKCVKVLRRHCPGQPGHDEEVRTEPMTPQDYEGVLPLRVEESAPGRETPPDKGGKKGEAATGDGTGEPSGD